MKKYPVEPEPLTLARSIVQRRPEIKAFEHENTAYTDSALLLKRGFRSFSINATTRGKAGSQHWHQMSDTLDNIEPDCLQRTQEFT